MKILFLLLLFSLSLFAQFSPENVAGLKLWLDASDASTITVSTNDTVTQWADKSGNANHVTNATGTDRPLTGFTVNGKNVIRFLSTSSTYLSRDDALGLSGNPDITIFIVLHSTVAPGSGSRFLTIGHGTVAGQLIQYATDGSYRYNNGSCVFTGLTENITYLTRWVKTAGGVYASATEPQMWIDGVKQTTSSSSATTVNIANTNLTVGSGHNGSPTSFYTGYIAEILIYNDILTDGNISCIEDYLNSKWSLGLTTSCAGDGKFKSFKKFKGF